MSPVEWSPAQLVRVTETLREHDDGIGARSTSSGRPSASQLPPLGQCPGLADHHRHRLPVLFVRTVHGGTGFQTRIVHNFFRASRRREARAGAKSYLWYEIAASQGLRKAAVLCGLFALCACTAANVPDVSASAVALRSSPGPNVVHPTDQVQVKVYNEPEVTGDYQVDGAGYLSIPLAGRIRAAGLTLPALEREIASRLNRGLIKDPKVNVQISVYAPFFIHGEVKQSGQFPYRPGMTVLDAVASAGGFTYRADEHIAYVRSAAAKHERAYPLTLPVPVRPGDNIRIGERLF